MTNVCLITIPSESNVFFALFFHSLPHSCFLLETWPDISHKASRRITKPKFIMKTHTLLFVSVATLLTGCASVKTIEIAADGQMASASVRVDVVQDSPAVQTVPVSQYFLPGNQVRVGASPRTVQFGSTPPTQSVSVSGMSGKVVVLAHLPGGHNDAAGDADARRKTIPLSGKYNGQKVTSTMRVNVSQGGISVTPVSK